jgi:pimeloyl-ACP methyl ester carboxylesterase
MTTQNEQPEYVTWRIPVSTPTWEKPKESLYISLLGSQTRIVQGKKYRTRVIEAGSGDPLILIHGVGGSAEAWYRNIMNLAKNFHVCAIDALFHGLSSKESEIPDQTGAQVDHVLDFMDAMGFEKAHVEGESMGSMIFFRLALEHPERVMRVILNTGHQVDFKRTDFEPPWKSAESLRVLTQAAVKNPTRRNIQLRMEWLMATPDRVIDELLDLRQKFYTLPEASGGMQRLGIMGGGAPVKRFSEEDCKGIKAETLVFWSQYNPGAGPDQGAYLASLIPGAKFYNMMDASHWPQYEHPEEHDAVVTKFLQTGQV